MSTTTARCTAAERYDAALRRGRHHRLPPNTPMPQPTSAWPAENVVLLERFHTWLAGGGTSQSTIDQIYIPMAGHILGLNLKPHPQLDLDVDLERGMDFVRAKHASAQWIKVCLCALRRFRLFLSQERGQVETSFLPVNVEQYQAGLPDWLIEQFKRFQHTRQGNWRPARFRQAVLRFWSRETRLWRWLFDHYSIKEIRDIKRQHIFDYLDHRLAAGYAPRSINQDLRDLHAFLYFLQEQGYLIPQALFRIRGLKEPDRLPRFLTDEQVCRLRDDLEERVLTAPTPARKRDALLDRAAFYLLWQGGMRLGEVEELGMSDLDLPNRRLMVRRGKGRVDRTVYLADAAVRAVRDYLAVRGMGPTDHLFFYRNRPLRKDLIQARIKAAGQRTGVKVSPHRLRHTYATQLVNAGCRITSIQRLLGHRRLDSTLIYARVHARTVAEDYYAAMDIVEKRLAPGENAVLSEVNENGDDVQPLAPSERARLLALVDVLLDGTFDESQRMTIQAIRGQIVSWPNKREHCRVARD